MYVMTYTLVNALRDAGHKCHDLEIKGERVPRHYYVRGNRKQRAELAAAYHDYRLGSHEQIAFPFRRGGDSPPDS